MIKQCCLLFLILFFLYGCDVIQESKEAKYCDKPMPDGFIIEINDDGYYRVKYDSGVILIPLQGQRYPMTKCGAKYLAWKQFEYKGNNWKEVTL